MTAAGALLVVVGLVGLVLIVGLAGWQITLAAGAACLIVVTTAGGKDR